jgi:hypothetical protein
VLRADPKDQKNPYASPVYGDFDKGSPQRDPRAGVPI